MIIHPRREPRAAALGHALGLRVPRHPSGNRGVDWTALQGVLAVSAMVPPMSRGCSYRPPPGHDFLAVSEPIPAVSEAHTCLT